jgi:hypothetical protein
MPDAIKLWSLRWCLAYGWRWTVERACAADTSADWLARLERDEPDTTFCLAVKRPRLPKPLPQAPRA